MARMRWAIRVGLGLIAGPAAAMAMAGVQVVEAHGGSALEPTYATALTAWSGDPLPWVAVATGSIGYLVMVMIVNRAHPATPVPLRRVTFWLAGMLMIAVALASPVDVYADDLLSVHMVQHLLLTIAAPPLLALGAPMTLLLRVSSPQIRRSVLLPVLHSGAVRAISWPPVGWTAFAIVMWATHFSPLFDAALENDGLHHLEHLLYLAAGVLFWWPVIGADPIRWRLGSVSRMVYLGAQMPINTAIGLAIYFAPGVLYPHYATLLRTWGPSPFVDQQIAGILMWGVGDLVMLGALILSIAGWLRADEARSHRTEQRAARHVEPESAESG